MRTGDERKPTGTVMMTMVQSSGQWLNGAMVPQHHYVALEIKDIEGAIIARVALTFEQVTRMLMYNGEVQCTLDKYRGKDGQLLTEQVEQPKTVRSRMKERLGNSRQELKARINDLEKDLYEALNKGSAGKGKLQELHSTVQTIRQHFGENDDFVVQQAEEELGTMQMQAACQLGVFLQANHGLELDAKTLAKLLPVGEPGNLIIDKSVQPVETGYVAKERPLKDPSEMTALEVGDEIHMRLKRFEAAQPKNNEHNLLFGASAGAKRNKVWIKYISYQGTWDVELEQARNYLTFLRNTKQFMRLCGSK